MVTRTLKEWEPGEKVVRRTGADRAPWGEQKVEPCRGAGWVARKPS